MPLDRLAGKTFLDRPFGRVLPWLNVRRIEQRMEIPMQPQPDDSTCGPTCLHAVYQYFNDPMPLAQVIGEVQALEEGGTLAVLLGCHALSRGYRATIYTFNLAVFDPSWFVDPASRSDSPNSKESDSNSQHLIEKLQLQQAEKSTRKLRLASQAYIDFLQRGGQIQMRDLNANLIRSFLRNSIPILTGLSSTYLYHCQREDLAGNSDDIRGIPTGHFVVLRGYHQATQLVQVTDPYRANPLGTEHDYEVNLDKLICSILLGVLTFDANLLVIEPPRTTC